MKQNLFSSVLECIGNTPMVNLERLTKGLHGNIFAKLEYISPGLSKKDRVALQIVEDAEKKGLLKKGQCIIELTSGNMGTGLSIVSKLKGYKFVAVMSKGNSIERAKMMKAFGAELVLVDQMPDSIPGQVSGKDLDLVEQETQRLTKELNAFRADQFFNLSTMLVGEERIANEILEQIGDKSIDVFVDFMGTSGSFVGVSRKLKKKFPNVVCFGVEPENAAYYGNLGGTGKHCIQGGGYFYRLKFVEENKNIIDGFISVSDSEAVEMARKLAVEECIFAGFSSGANIAAALKLLNEDYIGKNILVLLPDSGTKYLSTNLWDL